MAAAPHLWLALSPHGFGHATMTAPLVAELRRRRPELRLTIQTSLPRDFLGTRYADFELVPEIADFGFCMTSAIRVDVAASAAAYLAQHADYAALVAGEAARLRAAAPDLVLANIPYVTVAAASRAGIPVAAFSSLNWADLADYFLAHLPQCDRVRAEIRASYAQADIFLRPQPAQDMTLPNIRNIGPVARLGSDRRAEIKQRLGLGKGTRLGVIAFGGIDHRLPLERWPVMEGWFWLSSLSNTPNRPDMARWPVAGVPFADLFPSTDVIIGKPGYGTFSEVGLGGVPMLYESRPDWPEAPPLEEWLARHTRCLPVNAEKLIDGSLPVLLRKLFSLPEQQVAVPSGVSEGADVLEQMLDARHSTARVVGGQRDHDAAVSNGGRQ